MNKRTFKDKVFAELAKVSHALANPRRLEVIDLLAQSEKTVERIAEESGMSVANASKHLQVLKTGALVEIRRDGNYIYYRLADEKVVEIWKLLREFGTAHIAEVEKVIRDFRVNKQALTSVTIDELVSKAKNQNVLFLDVRPLEEYNSGHIEGAISIPIEKLESSLKLLPKSKDIIAYCRGPFCVFADEAVKLLLEKKYKVKRLEEGFSDWKLKGLPIEKIN